MTSYVFVTFTWRKCFRTNIYLLGLTITSCCQAQTERDFICAYKITARTQYMPTAALQYIWSRAADWLSEPTVNPFMFSMWVKLCISFAVWGISIDLWYFWYLVLHLTASFWLPLAAVSSEVEGESGEASGCKHSYPWLHWVKLKTEVSWYEWCASEIVTSLVIRVWVFIMRHHWAIFPSRNHHSVARRSQITARCLNPSRVNIAFKERMNIWSAARDKSLIWLATKLLHLVLSASSIYLSAYH